MSRYVEKHLFENELIVEKAKIIIWPVVGRWLRVILAGLALVCLFLFKETIDGFLSGMNLQILFWVVCGLLLIITLIWLVKAISVSIWHTHLELVLTNKRLIQKRGWINVRALDAPLDKIVHVSVETRLWWRIWGVYRIHIATEDNADFMSIFIHNANDFKSMILGQVDYIQESRLAMQANWTAQAMLRNSQHQPQGYGYPNEQQGRRRRRDDDAYDDYGYDL